jgi:sugar phosphate isomerase/epimerase
VPKPDHAQDAIRLACGDHAFPRLPHRASLALIKRLGFDSVALMLWGERAHMSVKAVSADPAMWAGRVAERAASLELAVADVMCIPAATEEMAPTHPRARERDRGFRVFSSLLEFAALAGAPGVTTLPGPSWPSDAGGAFARSAAELRRYVDAASQLGLELSIEPNRGSVCERPDDALRLCAEVPGLRLTLDPSHAVAQGLPPSAVTPLIPLARHVHLRGAGAGRLQAPLRQSSIDVADFAQRLRVAGYVGYVAAECFVSPEPAAAVDVLSETVLLRSTLRAAFSGERG